MIDRIVDKSILMIGNMKIELTREVQLSIFKARVIKRYQSNTAFAKFQIIDHQKISHIIGNNIYSPSDMSISFDNWSTELTMRDRKKILLRKRSNLEAQAMLE